MNFPFHPPPQDLKWNSPKLKFQQNIVYHATCVCLPPQDWYSHFHLHMWYTQGTPSTEMILCSVLVQLSLHLFLAGM